jgi:hypothetical protein
MFGARLTVLAKFSFAEYGSKCFCLASVLFSLSVYAGCSAFHVCVGFALVFWGEAVVASVFSLVLVLPFLPL